MRNNPRRRRSARVNKTLRRESAATGERRKNNFSSDWCGFLGELCPSHIKLYSYRRRDYSAAPIQTTSMSPIVRLGEACDSARPPTSSTTTNNEGVFHPTPVHILHHNKILQSEGVSRLRRPQWDRAKERGASTGPPSEILEWGGFGREIGERHPDRVQRVDARGGLSAGTGLLE